MPGAIAAPPGLAAPGCSFPPGLEPPGLAPAATDMGSQTSRAPGAPAPLVAPPVDPPRLSSAQNIAIAARAMIESMERQQEESLRRINQLAHLNAQAQTHTLNAQALAAQSFNAQALHTPLTGAATVAAAAARLRAANAPPLWPQPLASSMQAQNMLAFQLQSAARVQASCNASFVHSQQEWSDQLGHKLILGQLLSGECTPSTSEGESSPRRGHSLLESEESSPRRNPDHRQVSSFHGVQQLGLNAGELLRANFEQ